MSDRTWVTSAARVVTPSGVVGPAAVSVDEAGLIDAIEPVASAVDHATVCAGFIDVQVNGIGGVDVATATGTDWDELDDALLAQGTTAWCPTLVSGALGGYEAPLTRIAQAGQRAGRPRPAILGAHLEGPFISRAGAHRPEHLIDPDLAWLTSLPSIVRLVTLAPERAGALEAVAALTGRGVVVSLGHSDASLDQALAAVDAGARMVTHLFNGMTPWHHRSPGLAGAALSDPRLGVGLIADGVHVDPALFRPVAAACRGRLVLVTDAVAVARGAAGPVRLTESGRVARLADGTLAGSTLTMDRAVANLVAAGVDPVEAIAAATSGPADVLREKRGRIEVGAPGDLAALSDQGEVERVWVAGQPAWSR